MSNTTDHLILRYPRKSSQRWIETLVIDHKGNIVLYNDGTNCWYRGMV